MKPVIGLFASYDDDRGAVTCPDTYVDAIVEGGGKPLLIPLVPDDIAEEILSVVDGLVFPGGPDIDPWHFGERPNQHLGHVNASLDAVEIPLAKKALALNLPILGICRGAQSVTIASGGTLIQDIPTQVGGAMKHQQQAPRWHGTHEVVLDEDSLVSRLHGTRRLMVNSFHHQSIKSPGDGFTIVGRALDGIAEAMESKKGFRLLLQWHPEGMWKRNKVFLAPFTALCKAAKGQEWL